MESRNSASTYTLELDTFELPQDRRQLEDTLRFLGIEGEDAFYFLAYQYEEHLISHSKIPVRIKERGSAISKRVALESSLLGVLDRVIASDPLGENLPFWYQYFVGRRFREGSGKFFTPKPVAKAMVALLPFRESPVVMDPTCGGGTFLVEVSKRWKTPCTLVANDIDPVLVDLSQVTLALANKAAHEMHFLQESIFESDNSLRSWYNRVDFIIANPPFSLQIDKLGTPSSLFRLGYRNSDALFIDIAYHLLKDDGYLVCLLPHSIVANAEYKQLRALTEEQWDILGVISLPEGTFYTTAHTTTRADIVMLRKGSHRSKKKLFGYASTIGIALNNRATMSVGNELGSMVASLDTTNFIASHG
jgi:SAM-dependent methyltransferase